jgi:HSP20 family protein
MHHEEIATMDWKKAAPWNWFKDEEASSNAGSHLAHRAPLLRSIERSRDEFERLVEDVFRRPESGWPVMPDGSRGIDLPLRPKVDISEGKKAYTVRAELPGVDRDDVSLSVDGQTLTIRAEKRQEREEEEEGYHLVESAYGSVQRMLSLTRDSRTAS